MRELTAVSAKIPKELKDKIKEFGINPGPIIRRALEEEVRKMELKKLERRSEKIAEMLEKIDDEEVVRLIREDRER